MKTIFSVVSLLLSGLLTMSLGNVQTAITSQDIEENEKKAIHLYEGKWTDVKLESEYELPLIDFSLSYDDSALYIKARVKDTHFKDGNRAWRYGDGFFINIAAPNNFERLDSDHFYAYGFCLEKGKPLACLINHDGTYYLGRRNNLTPEIIIDKEKMVADYSITIPWEDLYPFHPLLDEKGGINIIYNSQNDDHTRKRILYVEGVFDSESTKFRRFATVYFHTSEKTKMQMTGRCETRLVSGSVLKTGVAIWSTERKLITITATVEGDGFTETSQTFKQKLKKGCTVFNKEITLPGPEGKYKVTLKTKDGLKWEETIHKYNKDVFLSLKQKLETSKPTGNLISDNSLSGLRYRFYILEKMIATFNERSELRTIRNALQAIYNLNEEWETAKTIYNRKGYLLSAFESPQDGTLQPFSLILPEDFNPDKKYTLIVGLHGSGVDEVGFIRNSIGVFDSEKVIIIAPRGRGLSDWWTGDTETDAIDLINLLQKMFIIDKTLCYGFSMGGYGTWRMTLLHPELFEGAVVISGFPYHPRNNIPENDMNNYIGKAKGVKFLVIHGTADRSLSIDDTDAFVNKLKDAGYDIQYHREEGGGHGDFFPVILKIMLEWLKEYFTF